MSTVSELPERLIRECKFEWKEAARKKCLDVCGNIGGVDGMPRLSSLNFEDKDIASAVMVPLTGGREMRFWVQKIPETNWVRKCTRVIVMLWVDGSRGEPKEDVVVMNIQDKFVSTEKVNDPVGLKFFARFDPKRDIDESRLNSGELQQKVVDSLRGNL